jgi:hypothetical protein
VKRIITKPEMWGRQSCQQLPGAAPWTVLIAPSRLPSPLLFSEIYVFLSLLKWYIIYCINWIVLRVEGVIINIFLGQ